MSTTFIQELPHSGLDDIPMDHPSDATLLARHHVFAAYHKNGMMAANNKLCDKRNSDTISNGQFIGIDTELRFYDEFRKSLRLVPGLDCGDHVDFIGEWQNNQIRLDVTTNLQYKRVSDFADDENHLVVIWNIEERFWESFHVKEGEFRPHPLFSKG